MPEPDLSCFLRFYITVENIHSRSLLIALSFLSMVYSPDVFCGQTFLKVIAKNQYSEKALKFTVTVGKLQYARVSLYFTVVAQETACWCLTEKKKTLLRL